jgi:glucokinase
MAILGIDLGGTNVRVGLVDEVRLLRSESAGVPAGGTVEEVLEVIYGLVDRLIRPDVQGIGVGVPSVIDLKEGVIYDVQNIPSWKKVPLKALLEKRYRIPAYINNDANCFAVAEKYYGKGKPYEHLVGLIVGTGLGAGVIANGRLYSGANCGAGEFGMIPYRDRNLEYYACGQFFKNVCRASGEEVAAKAKRGDRRALRIFREFGRHLGEAVKVIMYAADPEIIILGGSVSRSFDLFQETMWASVREFAYSISLENIKIEVSEVENIALLGAAALFFDAARA